MGMVNAPDQEAAGRVRAHIRQAQMRVPVYGL